MMKTWPQTRQTAPHWLPFSLRILFSLASVRQAVGQGADAISCNLMLTKGRRNSYVEGMAQLLTLGHSPDPDDAFMFYGLARELIPTHGFRFQHILQDIQTLNERATRSEEHTSEL